MARADEIINFAFLRGIINQEFCQLQEEDNGRLAPSHIISSHLNPQLNFHGASFVIFLEDHLIPSV